MDAPTVDELFPLPPGHRRQGGRPPTYPNLFARIVANTETDPDNVNACWVWTGATRKGYPSMTLRVDGKHKTLSVHRVALEELGHDLTGLEPDHLCYEPRCVNPLHLEPVAKTTNLARRRY